MRKLKAKDLEVVKLSPANAKTWLDTLDMSLEREIRPLWARHLHEQMMAGRFIGRTVLITAVNGEVEYLLDGQHRLMALARGGVPPAEFIVNRYRVEGRKEAAIIFGKLDQGLKRRLGDVANAYELFDLTGFKARGPINKVAAAYKMIETDFGYGLNAGHAFLDLDVTVGHVVEWAPYGHLFYDAIGRGGIRALITKAPVMGVALLTLKAEPEQAADFWHQVNQNDGIGRHDPRARLHRWLYESRMKGATPTQGRVYTNSTFALTAAKCWNSYLEGKSVKALRMASIEGGGYRIGQTDYRIGSSKYVKET